ncbi:tyrosine-type recombinase/integrase [Nonomuraea sp. NPDC048881]|uniref:tyrosine-type recombinase/integrase n=1 Tax=Nonomuraea sp. NPDC048881 TaxID=3155030 RepID=UPI0033D7B244
MPLDLHGWNYRQAQWTPSHTYAFLAQAATHRLSALYRLIALRGLRRGEAVGLRWKDVDLAAGTAGVHWQITQLGWEPVQGRPKTEASDRTIALDEDTVTALRAHRKRQAAERLIAGEAWADSGFVFTDEIGLPLHPQQVSDQFSSWPSRWGCRRCGCTISAMARPR